jgi:predicted  nucleic acid-binding Zn-ribbon protein
MANSKQQRKAIEAKISVLQKELEHLEDVDSGDKPDAEQANRIKNQAFSYTVHFERRKALKKVRNPGLVAKSQRRFTSPKEANHHGKRFTKIHKHAGYYVVLVEGKRANAWINWLTGKTNPVV